MAHSQVSYQVCSMLNAFEKAVNHDDWGQKLEALDEYQKVLRVYDDSVCNLCDNRVHERHVTAILARVAARCDQLQGLKHTANATQNDNTQMTKDYKDLTRIISTFEERLNKRHVSVIELTSTNLVQPKPSNRMAGYQYWTITIERIGLKDANKYIDAYLCVRVKDALGNDLCVEQNTATASELSERYVTFDTNIHLQKAIQQLPKEFHIFFEFMHFKPDKSKVSCRCFSVVSKEDLKEGCRSFELYKKPVDYTRDKLFLFTTKPLFLHLEFTLETQKQQKVKSASLAAAAGRRIAYVIESRPVVPYNRRSVTCCLPNALLLLLILLFAAATAQVALFHYYGTGTDIGRYKGEGSLILSPIAMTRSGIRRMPAKINLRDLVSRNVPSIAANRRQLFADIATDHVNKLLTYEQYNTEATDVSPSISDRNDDSKDSADDSTHLLVFNRTLVMCSEVPPILNGRLELNMTELHDRNYTDDVMDVELRPGGAFRPPDCHARHRVGLIVPYRDRLSHLLMLLHHLHPVLMRQQLDYRVFVVEQYGNQTFNKARIMNIAFITALHEDSTIDCFIFHDVDLMTEDDRNMYSCPPFPRHMSAAIDEMNYQVPYEQLVGGVFAIKTEQFFKVNGYSNLYWGWGAEDDDMAYRIQHVGLRITRPPQSIARYKMMRHTKRAAVDGRIRYRLLWTGVRRYRIDGLNSLSSLKYTIKSVKHLPLYTHILVDIGPPPPGF